jgi:hypothetical protein
MIGLYVFMFFSMLRGTIGGQTSTGNVERTAEEEEEEKESRRMAYSMLL